MVLHENWLRENIPDYDTQKVHILTCGAWDIGTCITGEFRNWEIYTPSKIYTEFINIKRDFEEFYSHNAGGMVGMLSYLCLTLDGRHHSGIDDCRNTAKIFLYNDQKRMH